MDGTLYYCNTDENGVLCIDKYDRDGTREVTENAMVRAATNYPDVIYFVVEPEPEPILPGEQIDGGTVIASNYLRDDIPDPTMLVLVRMPTAPHYLLGVVTVQKRTLHTGQRFVDIVSAAKAYADNGGEN